MDSSAAAQCLGSQFLSFIDSSSFPLCGSPEQCVARARVAVYVCHMPHSASCRRGLSGPRREQEDEQKGQGGPKRKERRKRGMEEKPAGHVINAGSTRIVAQLDVRRPCPARIKLRCVGISVDPWSRLFLVLGPPVVEEKGCRGRCWFSPPDRSALALAAIGYMTGGGGSAYRGIAVRLNWDVM